MVAAISFVNPNIVNPKIIALLRGVCSYIPVAIRSIGIITSSIALGTEKGKLVKSMSELKKVTGQLDKLKVKSKDQSSNNELDGISKRIKKCAKKVWSCQEKLVVRVANAIKGMSLFSSAVVGLTDALLSTKVISASTKIIQKVSNVYAISLIAYYTISLAKSLTELGVNIVKYCKAGGNNAIKHLQKQKILKDLMGILAFGLGLSAGILMLMSGPQAIILGLFVASILFEYTYSCYCEYIDKNLMSEGNPVKPEEIKRFSRYFLDYHLSWFKKLDVELDKKNKKPAVV